METALLRRKDPRSAGISDIDGITLSSLCFLGKGILVYSEACLKNLRGRFIPKASTTRKTGGSERSSRGFITSLHTKITTTPRAILVIATNQPMLTKSNGTVAGTGLEDAYLLCAKCQFPNSTPTTTPANATLSSKHGQSSA